MDYRAFSQTRRGAAHKQKGITCQDASAHRSYEGGAIAVVADGHGSRRHFRSDKGSVIACKVTEELIEELVEGLSPEDILTDEQLEVIKQDICDAWMAEVLEDHKHFPWTDEELEEERGILKEDQFKELEEGTEAQIAYGTTLCAAFTYPGGWAALQLGDGSFVHISHEGEYNWLMPVSHVNEGNRTASLCMPDPMDDFRHCSGSDEPAALLIYTDGIEKSLPEQGREVMSLLHWIIKNETSEDENREDNLELNLDTFSQRSRTGDDVSIAGIIDQDAEFPDPKPGISQKRLELERLDAQIKELNSTIEYNLRSLAAARRNGKDQSSGVVEQLEDIIERKRKEVEDLDLLAVEIREELGLQEPPKDKPDMATHMDIHEINENFFEAVMGKVLGITEE